MRCPQFVVLPRQAGKPHSCIDQKREGRPESRMACRSRVVQHLYARAQQAGISPISTTRFNPARSPNEAWTRTTNERMDTHENTQTVLLRGGAEEAHERRHFGMS